MILLTSRGSRFGLPWVDTSNDPCPVGDHVAALPAVEVTDDLASEVELVAGETLRRVAVTRPRLSHKQQARDFVAECDVAVISGWVDRVRRGDLLGEQLATEIADTCGVGL